ncbi:MAG: hypothetical protein H6817_08630 [Phycisphaerales bacterium]|nr:hypothetical protein [Phycisphaerales bacterium]
MAKAKSHETLARDLGGYVTKAHPDMQVEVAESPRWKRTCFTFTWDGFAGLLPEERFHIVTRCVPADYIEKHCRGVVWLELADGERIEDYLALPRSEDIAEKAGKIGKRLGEMAFFAALEDELVRIAADQCPDNLSISKRVLAAKKAKDAEIREAILLFLHHRAYTDWEVLRQVRPAVESSTKKGKR